MPGIIQRFATSAVDTALQMFWGAVLAGLLAGALLVYRHFGGLTPRWSDGATGALAASVFIAVVSIVMVVVRDWKNNRSRNIAALGGTIGAPTFQAPPSKPLPMAISPSDPRLIIAELKEFQDSRRTAKLPPFRARIMYLPNPTTTYLAEEFHSILTEAGWELVDHTPQLFTGDTSRTPGGITIWSSLTDPPQVAGIKIGMALAQVGIKYQNFRNAQLRHQDFCMVLILPAERT